jgi:hypothetical protein
MEVEFRHSTHYKMTHRTLELPVEEHVQALRCSWEEEADGGGVQT